MLLVSGRAPAALGLEPYAGVGVVADIRRNFRIADQVYGRPEQAIDEGVTGAELVVEVRTPDDESYFKLPFHAERGAPR